MALPAIIRDDFEGWFDIPLTSFQYTKFDEYITRFTRKYLCEMLGDGVYALLSAETSKKWETKTFDEYVYTLRRKGGSDTPAISVGLKDILKGFIYFEWTRDNFTSTPSGKVRMKTETSERTTAAAQAETAKARYNNSVWSFNDSMLPFFETFKTYAFECTGATIDAASRQATLTALALDFVDAGDSIWVDEVEYTDVEVPSAGKIVVNLKGGESPQTFIGDVVCKPFALAEINKLEYTCY